jgi:hypothetical protein
MEPKSNEFMIQMRTPDGQIWNIASDKVEQAKQRGAVIVPKHGTSLPQHAAVLGKGAASGALGAIPDTTAMAYNIPAQAANASAELREQLGEKHPMLAISANLDPASLARMLYEKVSGQKELPLIPSASEAIEKSIDTATGGYTKTPDDIKHQYEAAKFTGALAGPGGAAKALGKVGQKTGEKVLGTIGTTKPTELAGAAATGATLSALEEEGINPLAALGAGIGASGFTQAAAKGAGVFAKGVGKSAKDVLTGKSSVGEETVGRALSLLAKPNENVLKAAKDLGVDIPFNVKLDSYISNFLANSVFKSIFSSEKYKKGIQAADQKMIDLIKDKIESIAPENIGKETASRDYFQKLKQEEAEISSKANKLYDKTREYLTSNDKVVPTHTLDTIKELKGKLSADVPSSDMKFVLKRLAELSEAWGLGSQKLKIDERLGKNAQEEINKYLESLKSVPSEISLDKLIQQRSAFMRDIQYGEEARGAKGFMTSLISALDKDISSTKNKEFLNNWRAANSFYKQEIADRVRSDFAESLYKGQMPKEAFNYMTSPQNINELSRILGTSPAAKQVMQSLKRAKAEEYIHDALKVGEGGISYAKLAQMFENKSRHKPLLKALMGEHSFEDMNKLAKISQQFIKSGKQAANPSGTALAQEDFKRIGNMMYGILGIGVGTGQLLGTAATTAGINLLSRLAANQKYTDAAAKFALARQQNKLKDAAKHQTEMRQIYLKQILPAIRKQEGSLGESSETEE